ncbi:MAG: TolC family protein [Rubrivivax sp.]|nr:MAG: TolC family protein [Rubrivivax sp.]
MTRRLDGACLLATLALLGGCASLPPDGGFEPVQRIARERLQQDLVWPQTDEERHAVAARIAMLKTSPLSMDGAVQLALLNNPGLQAAFDDLGVSQAELLQASRLPNPGISFGRLRRGSEVELERGLHWSLAQLIAWPQRRALELRRAEQTRQAVAQQVLTLAWQVRRAYIQAVAADQSLHYAQQVQEAAQAGAELARRMQAAGNWSLLQHAREQAFRLDADLAETHARQAQASAREQLARLLGLGASPQDRPLALTLPERLPDLPITLDALPDAEQTAMDQRLDVQAARRQAELMARQLGLTRTTRFLNVLDLGWAHNSSNQAPRQTGYEISLELPLFDWGTARTAKAEALYMQSVHRAAQLAVEARSEVREAHQALQHRFALAARYRDEIVPLRQRIADEQLLRYNGMLVSVFDLLADARAQIDSVNGAIQAQRDFWLARADLDMALSAPLSTPFSSPFSGPQP